MLLFITVLAFVTCFVVLYLLLNAFMRVEQPVATRLKTLDTLTGARSDLDEEFRRPFRQRILAPLTGSLAASLMRFTPKAVRAMVAEKLAMAGGFGGVGVDQFLLLSGILALTLPAVSMALTLMAKLAFNKVVGFGLIAFAIGLILPIGILNHKIAGRKQSIQRDLPDVLDLLTVSVEAGLSFDGALAKLAEKMKGALVEEFSRALQEIRMGVPRRDALAAMGARCDVADLSMFTTSLIQADQLGVSIGNVLRVQSAGMREKRKQRAEEKAMKAPVKMMIPLVLFIFPTIFIVLLGPAIIQVIATFSQR